MTPEIFDASKKKKTHKPQKGKREKHSHIPHRRQKRRVDEYSEVMKAERPSLNPLKAFAPKPEKISFDTQQSEEEVVLLLRQHPVTQIKQVLIAIGIALLPVLFASSPIFDFLPARFHFSITVGWYLIFLGYVFESFLLWFFNVYIITDERIIDVDFLSMIYKNVSTAKIDNIEDITAKTGGFLASMINYGDIIIQTAGEKTEFEFAAVPQPAKVTALLNELLLEEEKEKIEGRTN
jgi:hypothetical protein